MQATPSFSSKEGVFSFFRFLFRVQGIHNNILVGIDDDGVIGMVNDHTRLGAGGFFHLFYGGHIYRDILTATGKLMDTAVTYINLAQLYANKDEFDPLVKIMLDAARKVLNEK